MWHVRSAHLWSDARPLFHMEALAWACLYALVKYIYVPVLATPPLDVNIINVEIVLKLIIE